MVSPEVNDRGEVSLEGHLIGSIAGFRFTLARSDDGDSKNLRAAANQVVAPEIAKRAERLAGAPNEEFVLATDGTVRWRGEVVANLAEGETLLAPRLLVLADDSLSGPELERVQDRLNLWLRHSINTLLESIMQLAEPADLEGTARGIAFQLSEHLGLLPRSAVADDVKGLDQDVRAKMRKLGVKFGAYHIYVPMSLKPAPRELALILWALKNGGVRQPGVSDLPQIVLSGRTSFLIDPEVNPKLYEVAGFKVAGKRAVRVDILERLADIIRPLIAMDPKRHEGEPPAGVAEGNGFRVTVEMTSLLGTAGDDFASILTSLGYRVRRTPKIVETPAAEGATDDTAAPDAIAADASPTEAPTAADLADAAVNDAAQEAIEGVPAPAPAEAGTDNAKIDAAAVDSAASDLGASVPGAEAAAVAEAAPAPQADAPQVDATEVAAEAAPAEKAEPEFDEVWFPGGRRDNARHDNKGPRRNRPANAPATDGAAAADGQDRPKRFTRPDADGKPGGRPRFEGRRDGKGGKPSGGGGKRFDKPKEDWKEHRPREQRETKLDPNSPWAALAALKNPKS